MSIECDGQFNWIDPKKILTEQYYHRRKTRKSLEIKKAKLKKKTAVSNRYEGNIVNTSVLIPIFVDFTKNLCHINNGFC